MREMMDITCPICRGSGKIKTTATINGEASESIHDCPHCGGSGIVQQPKPTSMSYTMEAYVSDQDEG